MSKPNSDEVLVLDENGDIIDLPGLVQDVEDIKNNLGAVSNSEGTALRIVDAYSSVSGNIQEGTSVSTVDLSSGNINIYGDIFPKALMENSTLGSGSYTIFPGNKLIQIFKASGDCFSAFEFRGAYGSNPVDPLIDDFENYTTEAEIEAKWVSTDETQIDVYIGSPSYSGSGQCLGMYTNTNAEYDYVTFTFEEIKDLTSFTHLEFWWYQDASQNDIYYYVHLIDVNGDKMEYKIQISNQSEWEFKSYALADFDNITSSFDWSQVEKFRFYCYDGDIASDVYADDIRFVAPQTTNNPNLKFELYKFDGVGEPTSSNSLLDFTRLISDDGNDSIYLSVYNTLLELKKIDFKYGVDSTSNSLINGKYYAVVLTSVGSDDIRISTETLSSTRPYESGGLFSTPDSNISFTEQNNTSMEFYTYTVVDSTIIDIKYNVDSDPLNSKLRMFVSNNGHAKTIIISDFNSSGVTSGEIPVSAVEVPKGDGISYIITKDINSIATKANFILHFTYTPFELYN